MRRNVGPKGDEQETVVRCACGAVLITLVPGEVLVPRTMRGTTATERTETCPACGRRAIFWVRGGA